MDDPASMGQIGDALGTLAKLAGSAPQRCRPPCRAASPATTITTTSTTTMSASLRAADPGRLVRLLQVDIDGTRVELHPYVSVVRGLEPRLRARLLSVIEGLATGATTESGLVEAHGVLLDLTPETLALLDLGGAAGAAIQPVVRADELPGTAAGPEALARAELHLRRSTIIEALPRSEAAASRADRLRAASEEFLAELDGDAEEGAAGAKAIADLKAIVAERSATRAEAERQALDATADDERAAEAHSAAVAAPHCASPSH